MQLITYILLLLPVLSRAAEWDIFMFTQSWPPAVCIEGEEHHKCNIPSSVKTWTVHGLWPTKRGTEGPTNCNSSWPFKEADIKSLESKMNKFWPNVFPDTKATEFWAHEWDKHGTCSTDLSAVRNEFLYFQKGLNLNQDYDIMKILADSNITPDMHTMYEPDQVLSALKARLQITPKVECIYDKRTDTQVLYEVEICFDKNFNMVDCLTSRPDLSGKAPSYSNCPKKGFLYPPLPSMDFKII